MLFSSTNACVGSLSVCKMIVALIENSIWKVATIGDIDMVKFNRII